MSVNIIWSLTNGGDPISTVLDHGNNSNGDTTTGMELFVRHDGINAITNVGLYMRAYSGTYSGTFTAVSDFTEIVGWGTEAADSAEWGGFMCNFNATGSYPAASWPTFLDKLTTLPGTPGNGFVHMTGIGDSELNAVTIPTVTGATTAGEIQISTSPNVRFKVRVAIPTNEQTVGIRQWDQVLRYSYTS